MARRFRLQFRLATLLFVVTVVAIVVGGYIERARRADRAIKRLESLGAGIGYHHWVEAGWFEKWNGFTDPRRVLHVDVANCAVGDDDLWVVQEMPRLRGFTAHDARVTDRTCAYLAKLENLTSVDLSHCGVRGPGLGHLQDPLARPRGRAGNQGHAARA
ncbi:MAG: hypothetical protein HYS13_16600 [Planctomycetia bacterium]|nr:hypothetical protein [Planctomycetia bacterium]